MLFPVPDVDPRNSAPNAIRPSPFALRAASQQPALPHTRSLHATSVRLKKARGKGADVKSEKVETREKTNPKAAEASDAPSSQHPTPDPEDPLNFADVESRLKKASESPVENLKKVKAGGRFNPDLIGALRVQSVGKDGPSYPLRELAQVVPKGGRTISILVHEADSIKPIMSAIQGSKEFNQQPQRDPENELELVLKMELEKREDVVKRVKAICHEWREKVRQVRQKRDKVHAAWKKDGLILPDVKRKADTELDKVIKAKTTEIDAAEKEASKAAEGK